MSLIPLITFFRNAGFANTPNVSRNSVAGILDTACRATMAGINRRDFLNASTAVMFDRAEGIRLTHSPSGGGVNADLQTTNPAWDFQFLVQNPEVMKEYSFRVRTVLRPRCSREELLDEFMAWKETK